MGASESTQSELEAQERELREREAQERELRRHLEQTRAALRHLEQTRAALRHLEQTRAALQREAQERERREREAQERERRKREAQERERRKREAQERERRRHLSLPLFLDPDVSPMQHSSSFEWLPPNMSELRVVLLGNSWSQRSSVGNFILGETVFNTDEEPDRFLTERGEVEGKEIVLINTPDLLHSWSLCHRYLEFLSDPGPHVFLLVLQPEDFTEEHKLKLCRFLHLFNDQSFDHSLVLISTPREESPGFMEKYRQHPPLKEMIRKCHYRFLWQKNLELPELLTRLGQTVKENDGEHLDPDLPPHMLFHMLDESWFLTT